MKLLEDYPLKDLNTFGFKASARYFISCTDIPMLQEILKLPECQKFPVLVLGGGSNILITNDFDGVVIKMDILGKEVIEKNNDDVVVKVGAGETWHNFVLYSLQQDWGGIENLSLIPGTVGAAPMQNIGAYGVEIQQVFDHLVAVDRFTGHSRSFTKEECDFGYRESVFKKELKGKYIICQVSFRLSLSEHTLHLNYGAIQSTLEERNIMKPTIRDVSDAVISIRKSKLPDPAKIGNSGSFFKNPTVDLTVYQRVKARYPDIPGYTLPDDQIKVPAGWLIEQCGWKGYEQNGIGVHKNQALVLVNYGSGTGAAVKKLSEEIQQSVAIKFGIELLPEVNMI